MANDTNKIKLLVLWDILCKNTDENHAMNSDEIREELAKRGISVMRKVVATDIAALNKYGYEVLSYKKKYYYYYVVSRPLETAEVVMLADVIKASKLTSTQKNIMIEKLSGTLCSHQAENLSKHITLAQEESRKTSERVRAGQKISRDKGVLYGNGNILGYDRDKNTGTYVINAEQAETVKMIYDLYCAGMGMSQIRDEMIRRHRKDSSGLVRWENSKISRILHNSTYKGYPAYLKSRRNNFLDQKIIRNRDEDSYMYVKGDFEPIISEEQWERCKQIREQRKRKVHYFSLDGDVIHTAGIHASGDVWVKKLKCRCGYRMRRNKWRKNKNGDIIYGYKCYNQLNNGSKSVRDEAGIDPGRACDLREICDWKLELMARHIFSGLWGNRKDILYEVSSLYQVGVHEGRRQTDALKDRLNQDIAKLDEKMKRLTRMRLEDEISKEEFLEYKSEIEKEREKVVQQRLAFEAGVETRTDSDSVEGKIQNFLLQKMDFTEHYVDRDIISQFVDTVIPRSETCYEWYMDFDLIEKPNEKKKMVWSFKIDYNEAKTYRKEREGMLRPNQWEDLIVRVYI